MLLEYLRIEDAKLGTISAIGVVEIISLVQNRTLRVYSARVVSQWRPGLVVGNREVWSYMG